MNEIIEHATRIFGVTRAELVGRRRMSHIAHARQAVAWAMKKDNPSLSLDEIGRRLGGREHTTIMYSLEAAEQRARTDERYAQRMQALLQGGIQ